MFPSSGELSEEMLAPFTYASMMNFRTSGAAVAQRYLRENIGKEKREPHRGHTTKTKGIVELIYLLPAVFVLHDSSVLPEHATVEPVGNAREHYERRF